MNTFIKLVPLIILPVSAGMAQTTTNAPLSGFQITHEKTDEARVIFLMELAQSYMSEEDVASAIGAYERILKFAPDHTETRFMVGHLYITTKQYRKAETFFLELIEELPDDFRLWNNLAWLYAKAEDPAFRDGKKAVRYAQEAMVLAPKDYHVWSTLSEAYYVNGDYEKAHRAILQMVSLAVLYGSDVTEKSVKEYNEQILKCKRAMETAKFLEEDSDEDKKEDTTE